jgi:hypothetical protein
MNFQPKSSSSQQSQQVPTPDAWGHEPTTIDKDMVFRVILQNPRGLKLSGDQLNTQYSMAICHAMGAGAICLPEANMNWGHRSSHKLLSSILHKTWKHSNYSVSYTKEEFDSITQPGGTINIITDNWTSLVIEKGNDPFGLGCWSYIVLRGAANKRIMIITAYRVCQQSVKAIGTTTAAAQQYRKLSKLHRESRITDDPIPRKQFIMDLQSWIEYKQQENYEFILSLDANESISLQQGQYCPLDYAERKPTRGSGHDGSFATLMRTCGLRDPLTLQHPDQPPPSTYSRGTQRIDFILVSSNILSSVLRSGLPPFDSIFFSDDRPSFVDFDATLLFKDSTSQLTPAKWRGLQLQDPRIVKKYYASLQKQLAYHKVPDKVAQLQTMAATNPKHHMLPITYNRLDQLITEFMLHTEKTSSKQYSTTFQWSPTLSKAVKPVRYWRLKLKQVKGVLISPHTITKAQEEKHIQTQLSMTTPIIVQHLREAIKLSGNIKNIIGNFDKTI